MKIPFFTFKIGLIIIASFLFAGAGYSQNDSLNFVNAQWQRKKISHGVKLFTHHFNQSDLFGANQNVSYVVVNNRFLGRKAAIAAENKRLRTTSDFAFNTQAIAAINGNFFDIANGGSVDFTKQNGIIINTNRVNKSEKLSVHQKAAIVINKGKLSIKKWDGLNNWAEWLTEKNIMLNGPLLLFGNVYEKLDSVAFNATRHPRTCVGTTTGGKIIMLVADGRSPNAAGMSLFELAKIMSWLGCSSAINFDGGGSSTLWVKSRGVVNYPSDNKKWDNNGQRKVANILYVK